MTATLARPTGDKITAQFTTRRFVRDTLFANLPLPFLKLRTYVWLLVFTATMGMAGYGQWSLFSTTLGIATQVASLYLGAAMMRFLSGERTVEEMRAAWSTVLATVLATSGLAAVFFAVCSVPLASAIFHDAGTAGLVALVGASLVCDLVYEQERGFLRARRANRPWAFLTLARLFPETAVTILVAWSTGSVRDVAIAYCACSAASAIGGMFLLHRVFRVGFARPQWSVFIRYVSYGAALLPGALVFLIASSADRYIVAAYLDMQQVGVYVTTVTVAAVVFFFVGPINDVLFPELSALYDANEPAMFRRRFTGIQKFILGLSAGFAALLLAFPEDVLFLATSGRSSSGAGALRVMGVQGLLMGLVTLYVAVLNVELRVWTSMLVWKVLAATILILDFVLIPPMGILGAAIAQLAGTVTAVSLAFYFNGGLLRQSFSPLWPMQLACGCILLAGVRFLWPAPDDALAIVVRLAVAAIAYWAGLIVSGYVAAGELRVLVAAIGPARWSAPATVPAERSDRLL
ncbi:MAG TPA: lipopolysaccharide biosynthesis protein [Gemmataceae bacterium]|nr:lipopolysaccharide biosynthesis protein [Gemmataceae bacterium]